MTKQVINVPARRAIPREQLLQYFGITEDELSYATRRIRQDAEQRREDAGYGGEWGDRGAKELESKLAAFLLVLDGQVPALIMDHIIKLRQAYDPEYQEFLRLQAKFGGKK